MKLNPAKLFTVGLAVWAGLILGCGNNHPLGPSTHPDKGRIQFALTTTGSPEQNIASGSVTINKGDLSQSQNVAIEDHTGTVTFPDIQVGQWSIAVQLFDSAGVEIYNGTGKADVKHNQTTAVAIKVDHLTGSLNITVELPGTEPDSATIDLKNNTDTLDNLEAVSLISPVINHQAVIKVNLDPIKGYSKVKLDITYGNDVTGWTLNIGDSSTNDGYGGDGDTQWNDAEFQILNGQGDIYANDFVPADQTTDGLRHLLAIPGMVSPNTNLAIEVSNETIKWNDAAPYSSPYLFALNGQADYQGVNYDIYIAFNRTVGSSSRSGTGIENVTITLIK
jgi:hypothetical protein